MLTIFILAFQGPQGGLTYPMQGTSFHWFEVLWEGLGVVDITRAMKRSIILSVVVMVLTVILSLMAGMVFRKNFWVQTHFSTLP